MGWAELMFASSEECHHDRLCVWGRQSLMLDWDQVWFILYSKWPEEICIVFSRDISFLQDSIRKQNKSNQVIASGSEGLSAFILKTTSGCAYPPAWWQPAWPQQFITKNVNLAQIIYFCFKMSKTEEKGSEVSQERRGVCARFLLMLYRVLFMSGFELRWAHEGQNIAFSLSGNRNWFVKQAQARSDSTCTQSRLKADNTKPGLQVYLSSSGHG